MVFTLLESVEWFKEFRPETSRHSTLIIIGLSILTTLSVCFVLHRHLHEPFGTLRLFTYRIYQGLSHQVHVMNETKVS